MPRRARRGLAANVAYNLVGQVLPALVGLVSTLSYIRLDPHREKVLAQARELAYTHVDLAGRESFDLPYVTVAYRAVRR